MGCLLFQTPTTFQLGIEAVVFLAGVFTFTTPGAEAFSHRSLQRVRHMAIQMMMVF